VIATVLQCQLGAERPAHEPRMRKLRS
jgi:hypothetical protein